jgi:DNA-binding NarL/FixJ family response regulator
MGGFSEMAQPPPSERVLIVDDDPVMRDVLSRFLRRASFEVTEVGSVVSALDELMASARNNTPYDHAVVDLVLKDGDGEDVVRACETLSPRPNIVVLSGNIDSRRALDLSGRCLYLPKPIGSKTLLEALRRRRDPINDFVQEHGLTARERDAVLVAASGLFNEEAADALGVTKEGLRKRWRQICAKTGCTTQQRVLAKIIRDLSDEPPKGSSGLYRRVSSPPGPPDALLSRANGETVRSEKG